METFTKADLLDHCDDSNRDFFRENLPDILYTLELAANGKDVHIKYHKSGEYWAVNQRDKGLVRITPSPEMDKQTAIDNVWIVLNRAKPSRDHSFVENARRAFTILTDTITKLAERADKYQDAYDYLVDNGRIDDETGEWL